MHRNYPSSKIFSINPSDFIAINGYNVLFLEMLAGRKVFHATIDMDHLHRKIEYESPFLLSSDHGSQISGYNSIKEDFSDSTQSTAAAVLPKKATLQQKIRQISNRAIRTFDVN
uniref:Uncharacterized protein n=1 Tax=Wuchereria bancrofti TaxID=6293 RepID=A0A1I8EH91_WUCBA